MLSKLIANEIQNMKCDLSIVLKDLHTDQIVFQSCEEDIFPSASMIKLPIMVEAFRQIAEERFSLSQRIQVMQQDKVNYSIISDLDINEYTFKDLITLMIIITDNTAANILIDLLGMEKINAAIKEIGLKNTVLKRKMMDFEAVRLGRQNLTSANDIMILLEKIYKKELLDDSACEAMLDILKRQKDKEMLKRFIPEATVVAHKTGELENLNHDAGIFYLENTAYILGVFVRNAVDNSTAKEYIGRISKLIYEFYKEDKVM